MFVYNMYDTITDPKNNKKYKITTKIGRKILQKYIQQLGGDYIGKGTYKCVFSPPIKCLGESRRYKDDTSKKYISSITTYDTFNSQLEIENFKKKIDPTGDFTIKLLKSCKIGKLDPVTENSAVFNKCTGNFLEDYNYPFNSYSGSRAQDLRLSISKNGGADLNAVLDNIISKTDTEIAVLLPKIYSGFLQVIKGVYKIMKNKVIHCDIKPGNILYNEKNNKYYIIDFGLMKTFSDIYKTEIFKNYTITIKPGGEHYRYWPYDSGISTHYLQNKHYFKSPLLVSNILKDKIKIKNLHNKYKTNTKIFIKNSKKKFDVFSLGVTMLEYFFSHQIETVLKKVLRRFPHDAKLLAIHNLSYKLRNLVDKMIVIDPVSRPSIQRVINEYSKLIKTINTTTTKKITFRKSPFMRKCKELKSISSTCETRQDCRRLSNKVCVKNTSPTPSGDYTTFGSPM